LVAPLRHWGYGRKRGPLQPEMERRHAARADATQGPNRRVRAKLSRFESVASSR
jgi:hypothetical protein